MTGRLRAMAWLALAGLAAVYVWLLLADLRFVGYPLPPFNVFIWVLVVLPWLLGMALPGGAWLLLAARRVGGGYWMWRWWCGGLVVGLSLWGLVSDIAFRANGEVIDLSTDHPWLRHVLMVAAMGPAWVLSGRWRPT